MESLRTLKNGAAARVMQLEDTAFGDDDTLQQAMVRMLPTDLSMTL